MLCSGGVAKAYGAELGKIITTSMVQSQYHINACMEPLQYVAEVEGVPVIALFVADVEVYSLGLGDLEEEEA